MIDDNARVPTVDIHAAIISLLKKRGIGKTICPSEAARIVSPHNWRELMHDVRIAASQLASQGQVVVTQRGTVVDAETVKGPIRIGIREK